MTTELLIAGDAMLRALKNTPCACIFEHPYEPRGKQKTQCARCRSMAAWQLANAERVAKPAEVAAS